MWYGLGYLVSLDDVMVVDKLFDFSFLFLEIMVFIPGIERRQRKRLLGN